MEAAKLSNGKKSNGEGPKKKIMVSEAFSQGEKDLYLEVERIKKKREEAKRKKHEEEMKATMPKTYTGMPETQLIKSLRAQSKTNYTNILTDAEVYDVEELFRARDKKGAGTIAADEFKVFVKSLIQDEGHMGKIPKLKTDVEIENFWKLVKGDSEEEKQEATWAKVAKAINKIEWEMLDSAELKKRVDKFYAEVFY